MASNDTAALVVALSAQLTRFEKDMKGAVDIADKRTREIEGTFTRLNSTISGKLSQVSSGLQGNIGFAGQLLSSLGPIGIAAAVGIGATVGAMVSLTDATAKFAEKSKSLKEGAETAGLTIAQFKLLGSAGKAVGLDFDETTSFFTKYIANLEELRKGGGPLFDALLKIDTGLLRQLSATKDSAQAIDLLVQAYSRLTDQTARLSLARAAGGRSGLSGGRLLESLGQQGGVAGLEARSAGIDEDQIRRAAQLKVEIEAIERKTKNIWGGMFSDTILEGQKRNAEIWLEIAQTIDRIVNGTDRLKTNVSEIDFGAITSGVKTPGFSNEVIDDFKARFGEWRKVVADTMDQANSALSGKGQSESAAGKPNVDKPSAAVELEILKKNVALLGDAITQGEQWRLKRLEIAAAAEKGGISDGIASRALAAFNLTQRASALAVRERLGVASQQEITDVRLAQLQQEKIKFGLSENEVQKATIVIMREARQAAEALEVRRAYLPGLKQLELDARNLQKGLDTVVTSGLNTVTDELAAFATGTKTASQAFSDMTRSILNDIVKLSIRQLLIGPTAGLLGNFLGSSIPKFAGGTDFAPGGLAIVGERGPEPVILPRGSQVIPNNVASRLGGGGNHSLAVSIDLTGANGDDAIRQIAGAAAAKGVQIALAHVPGVAVRAMSEQQFRFT